MPRIKTNRGKNTMNKLINNKKGWRRNSPMRNIMPAIVTMITLVIFFAWMTGTGYISIGVVVEKDLVQPLYDCQAQVSQLQYEAGLKCPEYEPCKRGPSLFLGIFTAIIGIGIYISSLLYYTRRDNRFSKERKELDDDKNKLRKEQQKLENKELQLEGREEGLKLREYSIEKVEEYLGINTKKKTFKHKGKEKGLKSLFKSK